MPSLPTPLPAGPITSPGRRCPLKKNPFFPLPWACTHLSGTSVAMGLSGATEPAVPAPSFRPMRRSPCLLNATAAKATNIPDPRRLLSIPEPTEDLTCCSQDAAAPRLLSIQPCAYHTCAASFVLLAPVYQYPAGHAGRLPPTGQPSRVASAQSLSGQYIFVAVQVETWSGIVVCVLTRKCRSPAIAVV